MSDFIAYLSSPQGIPLMNAAACGILLALIGVSILRQKISLGSFMPRIEKCQSPRAFWAIIILYGLMAVWTGVTAASKLL
jgi:hypothetical protein